MPIIKFRAVDPLAGNPLRDEVVRKVYEISVEVAKAVIATIDEHTISTNPISLQQKSYVFSEPTNRTNAKHLPFHTHSGDELEIYDHYTEERYKVTLSEDYRRLCVYEGAPVLENSQRVKWALEDALTKAAKPAPAAPSVATVSAATATSECQPVPPQAKNSENGAGIVAKAAASKLLLHSAPTQTEPSEPAADASKSATAKK